jgi:glycosyltransferase involved in cell wall biosynthesis
VRVIEIPTLVRPPRPLADLTTLWVLTRWIRRERFSIVHCHSTKAGLLGRFAARIAGVPGIVFTVHGWPFTGWWHPFIRVTVAPAERVAAWLSTAIICVCEYDRARALSMGIAGPEKVHVIHNGVAPERWFPAPRSAQPAPPAGIQASHRHDGQAPVNGARRVVSVGRLTAQKDLVTLLQAWRHVDGPHRLALVGDGPSRPDLEQMIEHAGLAGRVDLLGARDDVPAILREADLFVLSSRWEGLPLAVIEAMMSGLPVVATAVGGVPEEVVEGETGLLVPPGDPQALARALSQLLNDEGLRRRAGAAGQRRALEYFTEARMVRQTAEVYEHVLSGTI